VLVTVAAEDTVAAHAFATGRSKRGCCAVRRWLSTAGTCASARRAFLHALLHEGVRLAWARKMPVYVVNATAAVRAQIELVESCSLGG
jgi:hypothetical protein